MAKTKDPVLDKLQELLGSLLEDSGVRDVRAALTEYRAQGLTVTKESLRQPPCIKEQVTWFRRHSPFHPRVCESLARTMHTEGRCQCPRSRT